MHGINGCAKIAMVITEILDFSSREQRQMALKVIGAKKGARFFLVALFKY